MKRELPVSSPIPACARPDRSTASDMDDPGILNGVWRSDHPTYEEGIAAGLSKSTAAEEMGAQTIRMRNGRYAWDWRPRSGDGYCLGKYEVTGNRVTFNDLGKCVAGWEAAFRLVDDELRWGAVESQSGDPEDQLIRELLHSAPWQKID